MIKTIIRYYALFIVIQWAREVLSNTNLQKDFQRTKAKFDDYFKGVK